MKSKTITANLVAVFVAALLTGCGQKEIATLKTERDGLQAKLLAMEKDRDISASQIKWAESELAKASNGFQVALAGMSNTFQLERAVERAGFQLTNNFLSGQVEQLKADLDAQHKRSLADQSRESEAKRSAPIKDGLRALRKLLDAANVGTSIVDYNRLLIESQGPIREALDASDPETRVFITKADRAFRDAKTLWMYCNELAASGSRSARSSDLSAWCKDEDPAIAQLISDYNVPKESDNKGNCFSFSRRSALTMIWGIAKINLQQAEKLFSAQTEKGAGSKAD